MQAAKTDRRQFLCMAGSIGMCAVSRAERRRRPNVVIFYTDDQKLESFGFLRGKALTPHIDRLAREGVYFSRAYVSSSICSPSRYTCLTGRYASRCTDPRFLKNVSKEGTTKVLWNMGLRRDEWTFPKVMQQQGYKTGMVGKWHISRTGDNERFRRVPGSDPSDPAVKEALRFNQERVCEGVRARGFDYAGGVFPGNPNDDKNLVKTGCNMHAVEWQTRHALDFIETHREQPFMLYYATTLTHSPSPLEALQADPRLSPLGLLDEPVTGIQPDRADVLRRTRAAGVPDQLAGATWIDDTVGALMNRLDELGLRENTLFLYINDNGNDDQGKGTCYEGGVHVPMLASMPGTLKPGKRTELVSNVDVAATVFDLCGIQRPDDMPLDGVSLMPLLRGESIKPRDAVYLEVGLTRAVISGDYKYIAFRVPESYLEIPLEKRLAEQDECLQQINRQHPWTKKFWKPDPEAKYLHMGMAAGGDFMERLHIQGKPPFKNNYFDPDQLYNLRDDPRETTNLAADPRHAGRLKAMQGKLRKLLADLPGTFGELKR